MCALGTSGLINGSEAEPHPDGKWERWRRFATVGKTVP